MPSKKLLVPPALQNQTKTQPLYLFHIISPSSNPYHKFQVLALMKYIPGKCPASNLYLHSICFIHSSKSN